MHQEQERLVVLALQEQQQEQQQQQEQALELQQVLLALRQEVLLVERLVERLEFVQKLLLLTFLQPLHE
jgi:hypothetical protein